MLLPGPVCSHNGPDHEAVERVRGYNKAAWWKCVGQSLLNVLLDVLISMISSLIIVDTTNKRKRILTPRNCCQKSLGILQILLV